MAFKRLAWHPSYFTIFLGLFMLVFPVAFTADMLHTRFGMPHDALKWLVPFAGIPLCLWIVVRGAGGSRSKAQLAVDIPAGQLRLASGKVVPLAEVGDVTVEVERGPYISSQRYRTEWFHLKASNIPNVVLYKSTFDTDVNRRRDALEGAITQAALRPILERPVEGAAFRASPEIDAEVLRVAGTPARLRTALTELARDHDATIRDRAAKLLSAQP
jgi:hypothetical protein